MSVWNWWKRYNQKVGKEEADRDEIYPQSEGRVSLEAIRLELQHIDDAVYKDIRIQERQALMIYLETLVDPKVLQEFVLNPIHQSMQIDVAYPIERLLSQGEWADPDQLPKLLHDITAGYAVLWFEDVSAAYKVPLYSPPLRSIGPAENETTVLGPQDSFTEDLGTNLSLIKRRLRTTCLKNQTFLLGTETRSSVSILYMSNIANQQNVDRVLHRVQNVEFEGFIGMAVLKQMLEDKPYSPFPQFLITSRPDNVVHYLMDGRIIILLEGSPEAAIAPASFFEMFTSPEDFYNRWTTASLLRFIRFGGFFVTVLLTSTYVSVLTYHPEMLPPNLLILLSESRSRVPFPPLLEVLFMELVIEILREAGARMPTKIGQTIGIVGGIVIGTAAVEAGLASNILIVIVAISALLSFLPTNYLMSNGARFVRYIFILSAGTFGMFGQTAALAWMMIHLTNMTSLGTPYISPMPRKWTDLSNFVVRAPINYILSRMGISRAKKSLIRPTSEE